MKKRRLPERERRTLRRLIRRVIALAALCALLAGLATAALASASPSPSPSPPAGTEEETRDVFPFDLLKNLFGEEAEGMTTTIEIILLLTVLTLVPSILILMTSFTRIVIILSFTRNAMGTQQMPPNQVVVGLALFLTYFTMYGPISSIVNDAWKPLQEGTITADEAFVLAVDPLRSFMLEQIERQRHEEDLHSFMILAGLDMPQTEADIPTYVLIPAFVTSEIKTAFRIGFFIFIPFIVIDMVVASALMSMGMMMLPPAMISLPFKIMLFVLVDGWNLVVQSIVRTFTG